MKGLRKLKEGELENNIGRAFLLDCGGGDYDIFRLVSANEGLRLFEVIWSDEVDKTSVVIPTSYNIRIIE